MLNVEQWDEAVEIEKECHRDGSPPLGGSPPHH
jgi:hypothetical protein